MWKTNLLIVENSLKYIAVRICTSASSSRFPIKQKPQFKLRFFVTLRYTALKRKVG